jgi:hypothetical protein
MRTLIAFLATSLLVSAGTSSKTPGSRLSSAGWLAQQRIAALASGIGSQSGGCVNTPDDCEGPSALGPSGTQSETTIAVDSTGQHIVIGYNDFRAFSLDPTKSPVSISGFMYSDNGGATFVDGGSLPTGPTTIIQGQLFPQIFGDPDVRYLGGCNFTYTSLMVNGFGPSGLVQTLSVHHSTDCGHTWSAPVEVTPATNPNGGVDVNGDAEDAADKELSDVDPDTGRFMICWTNFTSAAVGGIEMSCTYSDNILAASPVFSPRRVVAAAEEDGQGSAVRFAGNGSPNAYVAWARFPDFYTNNIGFARSTDNGVTWSAPVNITNDFLTMDYVLGNDRVNVNPSLAVDKSPGAYSGYVYVVYSNNNSLDGADVVLQRSTDGGLTFSASIVLNSAPGRDRPQWFPYVTVDRTTGRVWVFYYDQGVASSGDLSQVTYLYSDDGGSTWSAPAPLTARPFKAGWGNDTSQPNLGDYNQAVAQFGNLYAAYAATTQPGFTDGQPSVSMTTPDVFFGKVPSGTVATPLRALVPTMTESGGNGNIDPGDQVRLKIPLENFVTNPLSRVAATGITATLSTATAGVTVVQPSSAYPTIAPGANALNLSDFVLQVSPAFVPGTPIEATLNVVSNQGTATLALTQQAGTPVYTTLLNETFDTVAPGALPPGWAVSHGGGDNVVPWRTSNSFATSLCGTSNKAFHPNANDAPAGGENARWERLFSPSFTVPGNADYVTVEFDVCYDTEDDPVLPVLAYDGFFLRITDLTPGHTLLSVLAEAFEQEFTTDGFEHYPKHFPRNSDARYFEDMSAWAGFSNGIQHVRMKLPGMAGSVAQLRFEFAQDQLGICSDVRPGHQCGVSVDNVVVRSVKAIAPLTVDVQVQAALSRDPSTNEIIAVLTVSNAGSGPAQNVQLTSVLLNGAAPSGTIPVPGTIAPGGSVAVTVRFPASAGAAGSAGIVRVSGSYAGGSFSTSSRVAVP